MALLSEKDQRYYAAFEVSAYGYGGIKAFAQATGICRNKIYNGIAEIESGNILKEDRIRRPGAGRKKLTEKMPTLEDAIELEANPKTDKRVIVKWASHSMEHIKEALRLRGFFVATKTVYNTLNRTLQPQVHNLV